MRRGYVVAGISALALVLVTVGVDWYGTEQGEAARDLEEVTDNPSGATAGEVDRAVNEQAREAIDRETDKAWEADAVIDRIILALIALTIVLAVLTWFTRALGAKAPPKGLGPPGACALLAAAAAVLVTYRIIQEPGLDQATHVKAGPVIALFLLAAIAIGASWGLRADDKEAEDAGAA